MSRKAQQGILVALLGLLALVALYIFFNRPQLNKAHVEDKKEEVHYHAGFHIYRDNQLMDFSGPDFMNLQPCGEVEVNAHPTGEIHLHDGIGYVAHVHHEPLAWRDLIDYLREDPTDLKVLINGEEVENYLDQEIKAYDTALFYDEASADGLDEKLAQLPDKKDIEEAELLSETCGDSN